MNMNERYKITWDQDHSETLTICELSSRAAEKAKELAYYAEIRKAILFLQMDSSCHGLSLRSGVCVERENRNVDVKKTETEHALLALQDYRNNLDIIIQKIDALLKNQDKQPDAIWGHILDLDSVTDIFDEFESTLSKLPNP